MASSAQGQRYEQVASDIARTALHDGSASTWRARRTAPGRLDESEGLLLDYEEASRAATRPDRRQVRLPAHMLWIASARRPTVRTRPSSPACTTRWA